MKVLVIGSGGREHALAWKIAESEQVEKVFLAPGNAGTAKDFINVAIDVMDLDGLIAFSKEEGVDLVVVGPEDPLSIGIVDRFQAEGIPIFGPTQACARFESSKDFTKQFLSRYDIPTAQSETYQDYEEALKRVKTASFPLVIKADGLCKGKGVVICQTIEEAEVALREMLVENRFGSEGSVVVIEEFLEGEEQSLLCFVSDNRIIPLDTAQDYKKIGEGDTGPNTGGVGVHSPSQLLHPDLSQDIQDTLKKIETGLEDSGLVYNGILFIGFMIKNHRAKVLEFNCRFGDPETQALLPRLKSDLVDLLLACMDGSLQAEDLSWSDQATVGVVLFSKGYPGTYEQGVRIDSLPEDLDEGQFIFHSGTEQDELGCLVTAGGRVLTALALADDLSSARSTAYELVGRISGPSLDYRRDIADL